MSECGLRYGPYTCRLPTGHQSSGRSRLYHADTHPPAETRSLSYRWPDGNVWADPVPYSNQTFDDDGNPLGCDVCDSKSCNNYSLCGGPQEEPS